MSTYQLQSSDGRDVGWVEFDPYKYEYTGGVDAVESVLASGPPQTVLIGETETIDAKGDGETLVQTDTRRDATVEERIDELRVRLTAYGVLCVDSE